MTPGERIGPYLIGARLGAGGMGEVYRATDERLGREVAVKVLLPGTERDPDRIRRFEQEARAAAQLNHPNIVAVFDVGVHDGLPYLVCELLEGETLRAAMSRGVTRPRAIVIAAQIAAGLTAAHAKGVVHRDLKPENVFITVDGRAKILDFGIARLTGAREPDSGTATNVPGPGTATNLTGTGAVLGTVGYMAPEQLRGQVADARADLFALGCILYELLSGRRAFEGATSVETGYAILNSEPAALAADTPPALERLVRACLEKDRTRRFQTAADLELALVAMNTGLITGAPTPAPSGSKRLVAGLIGAALLVAGVTVLASRAVPTPPPAVQATTRAPDAGVVAVRMTDMPPPASSNPEALALYRKGLQEFHDASIGEGHILMREALKLDPSLGAAHVRECLWTGSADPRGACAQARKLRSTLSARDQSLLDAFAPLYDSDVADIDAGVRRGGAMLEKYPGDAELLFHLGTLAASRDHRSGEAAAYFDQALARDPTFAVVFWARATFEVDPVLRRANFERCVELAPQAGACHRNLAVALAVSGDCTGYQAAAHRAATSNADSPATQLYLLDALLATGASRSDIDVLVAKHPELRGLAWDGMFGVDMSLATYFGSFDDVRRDGGADEPSHLFFAQLAEERGDFRSAEREARTQLSERKMALAVSGGIDVLGDALVVELAQRRGVVTPAEAQQLAETWSSELTRIDPADGPTYSLLLRAAAAATPDQARTAVDAIPDSKRKEWWNALPLTAVVGRAVLRAGETDRAIAWLSPAAHGCEVITNSNLMVRPYARYDLAQAYESKGDVKGACDAYGLVVAQWGHAKPPSITAEKAKARMKALRCDKL